MGPRPNRDLDPNGTRAQIGPGPKWDPGPNWALTQNLSVVAFSERIGQGNKIDMAIYIYIYIYIFITSFAKINPAWFSNRIAFWAYTYTWIYIYIYIYIYSIYIYIPRDSLFAALQPGCRTILSQQNILRFQQKNQKNLRLQKHWNKFLIYLRIELNSILCPRHC